MSKAVRDWSEQDVVEWLEKKGFGAHKKGFEENGILGRGLVDLTNDDLKVSP